MDLTYEQELSVNEMNLESFLSEIKQTPCEVWEHDLMSLTKDDLDLILNNELVDDKKVVHDHCELTQTFNVYPREHVHSPSSSTFSQYSDQDEMSNCDNILDQAIEQELGSLVDDATPVPAIETSQSHPAKVHALYETIDNDHHHVEPYIEMIAKTIMMSSTQKLLLSHIYSFIEHTYPDFTASKGAWKNSVRHNLSVNECFMKAGRAPNGRGYYWKIHPACMNNFKNGNFIRRDALSEVYKQQRRTIIQKTATKPLPNVKTSYHQYNNDTTQQNNYILSQHSSRYPIQTNNQRLGYQPMSYNNQYIQLPSIRHQPTSTVCTPQPSSTICSPEQIMCTPRPTTMCTPHPTSTICIPQSEVMSPTGSGYSPRTPRPVYTEQHMYGQEQYIETENYENWNPINLY